MAKAKTCKECDYVLSHDYYIYIYYFAFCCQTASWRPQVMDSYGIIWAHIESFHSSGVNQPNAETYIHWADSSLRSKPRHVYATPRWSALTRSSRHDKRQLLLAHQLNNVPKNHTEKSSIRQFILTSGSLKFQSSSNLESTWSLTWVSLGNNEKLKKDSEWWKKSL